MSVPSVYAQLCVYFFLSSFMPTGTIKKVTDKGFGFITVEGSDDVFFHMSSLTAGVSFDQLQPGQAVEFEMGQGPKGPKAENVRLVTA
jgi:CspA family cold shock protein